MTVVPEDRTTDSTAEEHVGDHNELARLHNLLDAGGIGQAFVLAEATFTAEQVSTCNSTPVSFVAPPAPGKIIQPVSISVQVLGGSTGFAESFSPALIFDRGLAFSGLDLIAVSVGNPLPTGANDMRFAFMFGVSQAPLDVANHRGIAFSCQGDHDIAYDGRIKVKMVYTLVDLLT